MKEAIRDYRKEAIERLSKVLFERQQEHGETNRNLGDIARLWSFWLMRRGLLNEDCYLQPVDVAQMMVLLKVARASNDTGSIDSPIDEAGYAILHAALLIEREDAIVGESQYQKVSDAVVGCCNEPGAGCCNEYANKFGLEELKQYIDQIKRDRDKITFSDGLGAKPTVST